MLLYILDKYIWEGVKGDNTWLEEVSDGGVWAKIFAKAVKEAAINPRPLLPPWNPANLSKYLIQQAQNPKRVGTSNTTNEDDP